MINEYLVEFIFRDFEILDSNKNHTTIVPKFQGIVKVYRNNISLLTNSTTERNVDISLKQWISDKSLKEINSSIEIKKIYDNENIESIYFEESNLMSLKFGSEFPLITLGFDSVTIKSKIEDSRNYANCRLNNIGFKLIGDIYGLLSYKGENEFKIGKQTDIKIITDEYIIEPYFEYDYSSSVKEPEIKIDKIPYLQFELIESFDYDEVKNIVDTYLLGCSYFMHSTIEFNILTVQLKGIQYNTFKVVNESIIPETIGFRSLGNKLRTKEFLQELWINHARKNLDILKIIIPMQLQSMMVRQRTRFLIRYNIIEICKGGGNITRDTFSFNDNTMEAFNSSLELILKSLPITEREEFKIRWSSAEKMLKYKPMKSDLELFLMEKGLPVDNFPVALKKITEIRNKLVHGSKNSYDEDYLKKVNYLMYRISGILILDLLGIKEWKLNTNL